MIRNYYYYNIYISILIANIQYELIINYFLTLYQKTLEHEKYIFTLHIFIFYLFM